MNAEQILKEKESLKTDRQTYEAHIQEVCDYTIPNKGNVITPLMPGEKKGISLYDSTAAQCNILLANTLHGILTNPASVWFEFTTGNRALDAEDEVRRWMYEATNVVHDVLNQSNFQPEIHEVYLDLGSVGTGCISADEDDDDVIRFMSHHISTVLIDENSRGVIDRVFKTYHWDLRQIAQEFGKEAMPEKLQKKLEKGDRCKEYVTHAVYPRTDDELMANPKEGPKSWKVASKWIIDSEKFEIKESGFREFPYAAPRWSKISGEREGRGPGMTALPDAKMVNAMMLTTLEGAQLSVRPPLQAPDDGFLNGKVKTFPNAINYYRSGTNDRIEPIITGTRVDFGYQVVEDVRKRIRDAFFVNQLQLREGPQMTATEVLQHKEEQARILGPVLGRQHNELLKPLIDRIFGICLRKGVIPKPIPEILSGRNLQVKYSSMIAKAQRTGEATNILRAIQTIQPFVAAKPDIMDNFDGDKVARYAATTFSIPQDILMDEREVAAIRQSRADAQQELIQQQQQQAQAERIAQVGPTAVQAAQVMNQ